MSTTVVLLVALALIGLVLYWSGQYGGKNRRGTTSLRRGPQAHTNRRGQPKVGFATREEAQAQALALSRRSGSAMGAYQCPTCKKWHVGHQ
jgi:hypothetical protein